MNPRPWTAEDLKALAALLQWHPVEEAAHLMGRSAGAVAQMTRKHGPQACIINPGRRRRWTKGEINYILGQYERGRTLAEICEVTGRSVDATRSAMRKQGFRMSQGRISATEIAGEYNLTHKVVLSLARARLKYVRSSGTGNGKRYRFTDDQAAELRKILDRLTGRKAPRKAAA